MTNRRFNTLLNRFLHSQRQDLDYARTLRHLGRELLTDIDFLDNALACISDASAIEERARLIGIFLKQGDRKITEKVVAGELRLHFEPHFVLPLNAHAFDVVALATSTN